MAKTEKRGLFDGGDREASIARFLRAGAPQSESVTELALYLWHGDAEPRAVLRFPRESVSPELATELARSVQDYADDVGTLAQGRVSWCKQDGTEYTSKPVRARPSPQSEDPVGPTPMDGSMISVIQLSQRHTEVQARLNVDLARIVMDSQGKADDRWERMFGFMERILERVSSDAEAQREAAEVAVAEAEEAKQLAENATEAAEQAIKEAEEARDADKLAKVVDLGTKALGLAKT